MDSGQAMPSGSDSRKVRDSAGSGFDPGPVDAGGRDGLEATAAILAGAGKDVTTAQERLSMLGQLPELPPDRYLDREESWLRFAQRVLELAEDPRRAAARAGPVRVHLRQCPR